MTLKKLILVSLGAVCASAVFAEDPMDRLFPIPDDARAVLEQRCFFCHGEVIDGEAELREDLNLSSEAAMRATLIDVETLLSQIEEDEMPQEAKLSFRLRKRPEMQARLSRLKEEYEAKGEKEVLLKWLRAAVK